MTFCNFYYFKQGIGLHENGRSQNIRAEMRPNLLGLGSNNDYTVSRLIYL